MFAKPVIGYEIITFNLSKWFVFEFITFKKLPDIMSYYVADGWCFNDLHDGEKSETYFLVVHQ